MTRTTCIKKNRDFSNKIVGYILKDENNKLEEFTPDELKKLMKNEEIEVDNLQIDTLGKLV